MRIFPANRCDPSAAVTSTVASCRPEGPSSATWTRSGTSAPSERSRPPISSRPTSPSSVARTRRSSTTMPRRRSIETGRHGPTTGGPAEKPGARPRSDVRNQRRFPSSTSAVRQRARGRRDSARSGVRGRQRISSSCEPPTRWVMSTTCPRNIDSLVAIVTPSSRTSAIVAIPSRRRTTSSPFPAGASSKRVRNVHSSSSRPAGTARPASRYAPATVPGTRAGIRSADDGTPEGDLPARVEGAYLETQRDRADGCHHGHLSRPPRAARRSPTSTPRTSRQLSAPGRTGADGRA